MQQDERFMKKAIDLAREAVRHGNEPFGAVLVKDGQIVYTNEIKSIQNMILRITRRWG